MTEDKEKSQEARLQELGTKLIPDKKLRAKLMEASETVHNLIVEANLPKRTFEFQDRKSKTLTASKPKPGAGDRDAILEKLATKLRKIAGKENANLLKTAGAIVIRVNAEQLKHVLQVDDVKAIRQNRKLPPIRRGKGD